MSEREIKLAAELLRLASDKFSTHGCCDLNLPDDWTQEECDEFLLAMAIANGRPEDYESGHRTTANWLAMDYLADRLNEDFE